MAKHKQIPEFDYALCYSRLRLYLEVAESVHRGMQRTGMSFDELQRRSGINGASLRLMLAGECGGITLAQYGNVVFALGFSAHLTLSPDTIGIRPCVVEVDPKLAVAAACDAGGQPPATPEGKRPG